MKLADFKRHDRPAEERIEALIDRFNRTARDYPRDRTVHAMFSECAARHAETMAVHDGTRGLTYAELERASNRFARVLLERHVRPESFVAVLLDNGNSFITAILGIFKAGAAYYPIEPDAPAHRTRHLMTDARCEVLVTETAQAAAAARLQAECPWLTTVIFIGTGPDLSPVPEGVVAFNIGTRDLPAEAALAERAGPTRLAYVMYTSGTSGRPKGVMVNHRGILRLVINTNYVPFDATTRVLMTCSVAFDVSVFEIWGALLNGGLLLRPGKAAILDPVQIRRLIHEHGITTMWFTSSLFNYLVEADVTTFAGLRYLLAGGERLSPSHIERVRVAHSGLTLINGYGPTENTTFTTAHTIDRAYEDIPIGAPIANTQVLILDAFGGLAPPGVVGEIAAAGDGLARGYLHQPALTADRFRPHPLRKGERIYLTGDLGRWMAEGLVEYLGRRDAQVKIRGHRVELGEVEARLKACPGVENAAVVVVADGADRALAAYVTGRMANGSALRDQLRGDLPPYMVPQSITVLEHLPITTNGKLDVAALPAPDLAGQSASRSGEPCETETEMALEAIWREVIDAEVIGATDSFFDLGGHSLNLAKLVSLVHQRLGIDLPLSMVFRSPTVREMARDLVDIARHGTTLADETLVRLGGPPDAPMVFALPPGTGDVLSYVPLAQRWPGFRLMAFNFIEADSRISDYADLIAAEQPSGPLVLLGYSAGGNLAFHVAAELERRGRPVANVVMIDSGRIVEPYPYLEDAVRQAAAGFLTHPAIQPYCATPVLRDKVTRKIAGFYRFLSSITDHHTIRANIDVVLSTDATMEHHHEGRLIAAIPAWVSATQGTFRMHRGEGTHNEMLIEPALKANAQQLGTILAAAFRG